MHNITIDILPINANERVGKVILQGDLTLVNAVEIRNKLQQATKDFIKLEVNAEHVTNLDLSAIQLFYSLLKGFPEDDKSIAIEINLSSQLKTLIEQSGFEKLFSLNKNQG